MSQKQMRKLGIVLIAVCLLMLLGYAVSTTYGHWPAGGPHRVVRIVSVIVAIGAAGMILLVPSASETYDSSTGR